MRSAYDIGAWSLAAQCSLDFGRLLAHASTIKAVGLATLLVPDVSGQVVARTAPIFFPVSGVDAVNLLESLPPGSTIGWRRVLDEPGLESA